MKPRILQLLLVITLAAAPCAAETGYVTVLVKDAQGRPVRGLQIGIENGDNKLTGDDGKAQLALASGIVAGNWITYYILHSPPGSDFVIDSPWDSRDQVPLAGKPESVLKIVVVQRGDRAALESGTVLGHLAEKIIKESAPKSSNAQAQPSDPEEALRAVAKQYDLNPNDVDKAIRSWGAKTTDPYEVGLAALYERNYPKATSALEDSLHQREKNLEAEQKLVTEAQKSVADAAVFLGQSLYEQGHYRESAEAYQKCLTYRPNDPVVINNLALSLSASGNYAYVEPLYKRALAIDEKALGPDHPSVATYVNNLATLYYEQGKYSEAELLYRRALAIDEKALGPGHPSVARDVNNLAALYDAQGKYSEAEPLYRRALAIDEKALGPDHPGVAIDVNNLAFLYDEQGKYSEAEPLYRRALAIDEKALGPDHPSVATYVNNLAALYDEQGKYSEAEPLYRRALAIDEKALGPDHHSVARDVNNLAALYYEQGKYSEAEPLYRRALAIDEKALGPGHPSVAIDVNNLAELYDAQGKYSEAEPLYRRALAIDEKALGPDHPSTKTIRENLAALLKSTGKTEQ